MADTQIRTVAIVGAGTMGPDVAAIFAQHGFPVRLNDVSPAALEKAERAVASAYEALIEGGLATAAEAEAGRARVAYTLDQAEAVREADFVLEAIPEILESKQRLFRELEDKVRPGTILASNSSGIPIGKIAEAAQRPGRIIGTHWLNQPHIIPVIEVVQGPATDAATVEATLGLLRQVGMVPVLIRGNLPGFVHNRILFAVYREVLHMLEQGLVSAEDIDNVTKWAIGPKLTAIGPFEMLDVAGLDVYQNIARYLNPDLSAEAEVSPAIGQRVEQGALGLKSGQGMFHYEAGQAAALMRQRRQLMLNIVRLRHGDKGGV
jgi:3-hydroxybutyryl-CoA dehydrogenase/5-formyl-3-hydroxy-2-methylpyridine 4-carboxylate dehydrogenase